MPEIGAAFVEIGGRQKRTMGKAARKKADKKNKFYKNAKQEEVQTPMSKELLYGVATYGPFY